MPIVAGRNNNQITIIALVREMRDALARVWYTDAASGASIADRRVVWTLDVSIIPLFVVFKEAL